MRRRLFPFAMVAYCIGILLACDLVYSHFVHQTERNLRVPDPRFDHGLAANFDGYEFMRRFYKVYTNSLGFKDAAVRDIPATTDRRRVLLIGDSFIEGVGLRFEETVAGLLYRMGNERSEKIEFLNASAATYSPVIYYQKIKYLLETGFRFDEVVVFVDISDVPDEATSYFCIDDDPQYREYCRVPLPRYAGPRRTVLQRNFVVIDATIRTIRQRIQSLRPMDSGEVLKRLTTSPLARWTVTNDFGTRLDPLGVEGGIKRALQNMQKLADLLASQNIKLSVAVYPWMYQLAVDDQNSRQVAIWQDFCATHCSAFIDLFPAFFAEKESDKDWQDRLFIPGDFHFSTRGHQIIFREIVRRLL
jgi:lysophospholipase L1-like esterase